MKRILIFLMIVAFSGCKNFEVRKLSSDELVREELEQIDWESLDSYPSFEVCDNQTDKMQKRQCFEQEVAKHIFEYLQKHEVVLKDSIKEQVELILIVSAEGNIALDDIALSSQLENQIPEIKNWLKQAVEQLPAIYPAEKRGIPVKSKYKLPLVIESD